MGNIRPDWCKYPDCVFKRSGSDCFCVGILPKPLPHGDDFNTYRLCMHNELETISDIQLNDTDIWWLRWLFNSLDGK